MKMTRRVLALLLALCLTFGNVMPAMATGLEGEETVVTEEITPVVSEVEETEAPADAEEPAAPVADETEAPAEVEETEAPIVETEEEIVDEAANEAAPVAELTPAEIVDAAYALAEGESMEGTYTLTGTILSIPTAYNATYGNITVTIAVEGKEDKPIECYRLSGTGADQLAKNDVITVTGTLKNYNGKIEFDQGCTLDSYVKGEPEEEIVGTTYTFSNYAAGTQYAENEEHVLDDVVTVITNGAHFTTQIRLYDSSSYDATAVIKSTKYIDKIVLNAGNKAATLNVYGSNDGATWDLITGIATATSYIDYTVDVPDGYNYLKLDAVGAQIRVAFMTIAFGDDVPVVDPEPSEPTEPVITFAFDNSGTGWDKVDAYVAPESGDGYRIDLVKTEGDVYYFSPDEYFPLTVDEIKSVGFCEYAGGGYTDIIAYENGKTYSASDFTITDDFITIYWDNSVAQYEEMDVEYGCQHGGYEGPMVGHFGGWSFAKSIEGNIYTFELPACVADCVIWIGGRIGEEYQEDEYIAVDGMIYPAGEPYEPDSGETDAPAASISFADGALRTAYSADQQVWTSGDLVMTNDKAGSTSDIYDIVSKGYGEVRLYASSKVTVAYPGMTKVVFTCDDYKDTYVSTLESCISSFGTVTVDGLVVTLELSKPMNSFTYLASAQHRLTDLAVYGTGVAVEEEEFVKPTTPAEIVAAAYALEAGETLKEGPYTLTGVITEINTEYSADYNNITVTIAVEGCEDQPIECFRMKGTGADTLAVDDTITVTGELINYSGTIEFTSGCTLDAVIKPEPPVPGSSAELAIDLTADLLYEEDFAATVTVPAGKTYYYMAYRVGGMEMSINDGEAVACVTDGMMMPYVWSITNDGSEDAEYVIKVSYPVGTQMNPEQLYLGSQYTSLAAGNDQGYYYTYTADSDAVLEFSFAEGVAEGAADIAVTNMNTYAQKSILWDAVDGVASIEVTAGDVLQITVAALPDANYNYPAMDLMWSINYPAGTEQNPEMIEFSMDESYTQGYATVTIPAKTTYYFQAYGIGGMELFVNEEAYMLLPEVMGRMPVVFTLTNETEEEATYELRIAYPAGHQMNPAELMVYTEGESWDVAEGQNVASVSEGSWNGYTYRWFAPKAGELTITVSNGRAGWSYSITNLNTYAQTDLHSSYDVPNVNTETITVNAGDEIMISVNSCGESYSDVTPAGDIHFTASFAPIVGTEENPLQVEWNWNDAWTEATATITVPANTSIFASFTNGGMLLTVNDDEPVMITGNGWMPQVLEFKGAEEGETVYNLKMSSPAGTYDNPAELVIGENSCEIEENSNGYTYKWIAEADGDLTITMGDNVASWSYVVNNLTTYMYGETYSSNDEVVVASQTIPVAAGDEIQITINTAYDWEAWSSPAGTVTFTAEFAIPEGAEGNPIFVQFEMDESYMYGNAFVTVPAYTTYYFQSYGIGGMTLEIATEQAENEGWWIVDSFTLPNVMGRQPVVFSVTNDTAEDKEYGLSVSWAIGSQMNPRYVDWMYGNTSMELAEGDSDGYYYTHTARVTGSMEFHLNQALNFETGEDVAADIIVTNMNTYEQKVLSVDSVDGMMYMDVTEGDELQIIVTAQPDENWNYPAAYISWGYNYIEGTETNPAWMEVGKNSVKIEAGDEDGFYLMGMVEETGYLTITMNSSNWEYKVGKRTDVFDDDGWWIGTEIVWSDLQASNAGGAKSQTIYFDHSYGENYYLYINTANKKAGTVTFTATLASKLVDLTAGQTATLTFTDPATGKAIAASKADWEIYYIEANGEEVFYENFSDYATLANGKLTAAAGIESEVKVYVAAVLKTEDSAIENHYEVYIRPAASSIQINKGHIEETYNSDVGGWMQNWVTEEENVTELTYVVNGDDRDFRLTALVGPDAALQGVTWKSSNTKILEVGSYNAWTENGEMQVAYLNTVYNPKTGKVGTGTVTLTATANDGSGVKATVKVNVVLETKDLYIYTKNDQWMVGPGKSVNMIAEAYTWYNQAPTNKNVIWDMEIVSVFDYETYEWVPYVPAEGEAPIATISNKGVVKAASSVDKIYEVVVRATAEDTGVSGIYYIYVAPLAKTGEIVNVPETYDISSGETVQPWANFYDANGKETMSGYTWNSSNKNVAEFIWVIDSEDEYGNTYGHYELQFTGKTGKVTLTATATDGSRVKATTTINVVKVPNTVEMVEEASIAAGKTLTLKATPAFVSYDWENDTPITDYAVSDKNVLWDAKVVEWNEDMWEWVEVEQDIGLKISNGKLSTNAKKITGTEPITVKVTATAKLGVYDPWFEEMNYASATCIVTVYPATKQVDLVKSGEIVSKKTLTVEESNYIVLDAVGAPVGEYIWKSSNEKVAVIENNPDGSVTVRSAGKMGKATITATANDGTKKSAKVTVNFVKAVEEIYFPEDLFLSVAKGKSVNFSKTVVVGPTDASNKKLTWSMEWVEPVADEEGYIVDYVTKGDGIVPKTVATMSNGSVKAVMKNVTDYEYVRITATAADKYGATCEAIVVLAPNAIKGMQLHLVNEDGLPSAENYAKKKYTTTDSQVVLRAVATNGPDDLVASGLTFTSSNKNFEVVWGDMGIVVRPVKDAVNPYGTVKVTMKATDGSNANTNITIIFAEPEAE